MHEHDGFHRYKLPLDPGSSTCQNATKGNQLIKGDGKRLTESKRKADLYK
jgi:hypothetical protein